MTPHDIRRRAALRARRRAPCAGCGARIPRTWNRTASRWQHTHPATGDTLFCSAFDATRIPTFIRNHKYEPTS